MMRCPNNCDSALVMSERSGIEIDYCPTCRGVWLDRGELDKIIERNAAAQQASIAPPAALAQPVPVATNVAPPAGPSRQPDRTSHDGYAPKHQTGSNGYPPKKKKKRGGFLEDLFEF